MRILITGGGGLIGSHVIPMLEKDHQVITISGKIKNANNLKIDFSKDWSTRLLPDNIDAVIHLAQSEDFRDFPGKAKEVFNTNTISTLNLIDFAVKKGVKKFIYASSAGVYGTGNDAFTEDHEIMYKKELGFYLGTKYCSEIILQNYNSLLDIQILRFFFVYGKGQRPDMLIPRLVNNILKGNPVTLTGTDGLKINPLHADDAAKAICSALKLEGSHTINAGGPEVLSLRDICEAIGTVTGKTPKYIMEERESGHIMGNIAKMKAMLTEPGIKFSEGIKSLI